MPTSKLRHRVEIRRDLYERMQAMATREGYPVARFHDQLLELAMAEYTQARQEQRYPFARMLGGVLRGFCR